SEREARRRLARARTARAFARTRAFVRRPPHGDELCRARRGQRSGANRRSGLRGENLSRILARPRALLRRDALVIGGRLRPKCAVLRCATSATNVAISRGG